MSKTMNYPIVNIFVVQKYFRISDTENGIKYKCFQTHDAAFDYFVNHLKNSSGVQAKKAILLSGDGKDQVIILPDPVNLITTK